MLSFTQPSSGSSSSGSSSSLPGSDDSDEHVCTILYLLDRFGVSDHFYHELSMVNPCLFEVVQDQEGKDDDQLTGGDKTTPI